MNLTLIIKDKYKQQTLSTKIYKYKQQTLSTKIYHIMTQLYRYSHKDSKISSFSILWFFYN